MTNGRRPDSAQVLGIIPVRERDVVREGRMLELGRRPLPAHTFEAATSARLINRVVACTDGELVANLARSMGLEVPGLRPKELAAPDVPLGRVLRYCLERTEREFGYAADVVVILEVSHPIRPAELIDKVVEVLLASDLDSVFTAYEDHHAFWKIDEHGELRSLHDVNERTRTDRPPLYREASGLVCASRAEVIRHEEKLGQRVGLVPLRDWTGLIDTQDEFGLLVAEQLLVLRGQVSGYESEVAR